MVRRNSDLRRALHSIRVRRTVLRKPAAAFVAWICELIIGVGRSSRATISPTTFCACVYSSPASNLIRRQSSKSDVEELLQQLVLKGCSARGLMSART
jgi:hypothetical protein